MQNSAQKFVDFEEALYYYNNNANSWEEKSEIKIVLETSPSFQPLFEKRIAVLSIKSNNSSLKPQIIEITYEYEFHYYPKKTFKAEKDFKDQDVSKSLNIPNHVIVISKKEIYEDDDDRLFFCVFGCNCLASSSKEKISLTLAKLYSEVRYSSVSIIHQVKERLESTLTKCFKDIVRYLGSLEGLNSTCTSNAEFLYNLLKKDPIKFEENQDYLIEFENLVYKCITSEGLFPIYCEINTMNTNAIRLFFSSILIPDSILPWSPKFHASFCIADFHYSFNPNNRMNTKKMKDRTYRSNFFYVRIKILDFFPLDHWVKKIARFFFENLSGILLSIRAKYNSILGYEVINLGGEEDYNEFSKDGTIIGQGDILIRSQETQDAFGNNAAIPKDYKEAFLKELKEPFLKTNCFIGKLFNKPQKKKDVKYEEKIKSFKGILKKEFFPGLWNQFPEIDMIISEISWEFYENYKFELTNTQILWNICKIIARTELRQYETLSNNCQTPVAESLHIIHEKLKQFIEPLQEKKDFNINSKKIQNDYFKFASKITKLMNEKKIIKPTVLDCNLDYFGIYADKYLQKYLENIKKVKVLENLKKVNDKIAFSEKSIENLFENFGNKYRTVFDIIKENNNSSHFIEKTQQMEKTQFSERFNFSEKSEKINIERINSKINEKHEKNEKNFEKINERLNLTEKSSNNETYKLTINSKNPDDELCKNGSLSKKKPKKPEKINRALSYFMFMCENIIYNYKIRIASNKQSDEIRNLILKKYEMINLLREFSYYYFNSIRLKNSYKLNKNNVSYVGFIIIKDPGKLLKELPENGKEIYASAYM